MTSLKWDVSELLGGHSCFALLLLNGSILPDTVPSITPLWLKASIRVCVDGATNGYHHLLRYCFAEEPCPYSSAVASIATVASESSTSGSSMVPETAEALEVQCSVSGKKYQQNHNCSNPSLPLPDFISGDFDSVEPCVLNYYKSLGVKVIHTPDQDETDFTKALSELQKLLITSSYQVSHVVVMGSIGHQRFDHVIGNINTLHKCQKMLSVPVVLVANSCVMFVLQPGAHSVCNPHYNQCTPDINNGGIGVNDCDNDGNDSTKNYTNEDSNKVGEGTENWCAYIPCAGPATVTTTGLKWNIESKTVRFGGLVSTSNAFCPKQPCALITTDQPLLWLMATPPLPRSSIRPPLTDGILSQS